MNEEEIIFVFPGQGSQYVGMGHDLFKEYAVVRHTFEELSDVSHKDIAKYCFEGPQDVLNKPELTSLGTFVHSVSIARIVEDYFKEPLYKIGSAITGHSMGQYSALHCAGSLTFKDAAILLSARSTYMSMTDKLGGGMAVIVGLDKDTLEKCLIAATGHGYVAISNHNSRDQFTISGQNEALDVVVARALKDGAKVAKRLSVAVPAHCALMENAKILLRHRLETIEVRAPRTKLFSNQSAAVMSNPEEVKEGLAEQMTNGVQWVNIMENLPKYNITTAYELGPGRTLSRLIQRADIGIKAYQTDNLKNVQMMINQIEKSKSY